MKKELKNYNDLKKSLLKLQEELANNAKTELAKEVAHLFSKYPECKSLGVAAYTPYFNDGDVCEFRVNSDPDSIYVNGEYAYDYEDEKDKWIEDVSDEFSELIQAVPEEIFKSAFGDHIKITFNKSGSVKIDDYDHE